MSDFLVKTESRYSQQPNLKYKRYFFHKERLLGILNLNSRVELEIMNDMRGYAELWQYVKVSIVKTTRSILLTRATIQV